MTKTNAPMVAGEDARTIARALSCINTKRTEPNGMVHISGVIPRELTPPFTRAFARIDAEFLIADAELVGQPDDPRRTDDQRRADVLVELAVRVGAALA